MSESQPRVLGRHRRRVPSNGFKSCAACTCDVTGHTAPCAHCTPSIYATEGAKHRAERAA